MNDLDQGPTQIWIDLQSTADQLESLPGYRRFIQFCEVFAVQLSGVALTKTYLVAVTIWTEFAVTVPRACLPFALFPLWGCRISS